MRKPYHVVVYSDPFTGQRGYAIRNRMSDQQELYDFYETRQAAQKVADQWNRWAEEEDREEAQAGAKPPGNPQDDAFWTPPGFEDDPHADADVI